MLRPFDIVKTTKGGKEHYGMITETQSHKRLSTIVRSCDTP